MATTTVWALTAVAPFWSIVQPNVINATPIPEIYTVMATGVNE